MAQFVGCRTSFQWRNYRSSYSIYRRIGCHYGKYLIKFLLDKTFFWVLHIMNLHLCFAFNQIYDRWVPAQTKLKAVPSWWLSLETVTTKWTTKVLDSMLSLSSTKIQIILTQKLSGNKGSRLVRANFILWGNI